MINRIWFAFCGLFLIFNLKLLIGDYYSVNYMIVEENDKLNDNITKFLICITFDKIKQYKPIYDNRRSSDVSIKEFLNLSINYIELKLKTNKLFKLEESFIFYKSICFLKTKEDLEINRPLNGLLEYYQVRLYYYSKNYQPIYGDYVYFKSDLNSNFYRKKMD